MAHSRTSIINLALIKLGQAVITDVTENTNTARLANAIYDQVLDEVLSGLPETGWKFARHRQSVSVESTAPEFGFDYSYQMPANPPCLRIISVELDGTSLTDWIREGDLILTNEEDEEVDIVYVKRVTDEGKFPPHFVKVFYYTLAKELCHTLSANQNVFDRIAQELELKILPRAIAADNKDMYVEEYNTDWVDEGH